MIHEGVRDKREMKKWRVLVRVLLSQPLLLSTQAKQFMPLGEAFLSNEERV